MTVTSRSGRASWLAIAWLLTSAVFAGDEVDYSAPYLVVEDGELVTKYPDQEHQPGAGVGTESDLADKAATAQAGTSASPAADNGGVARWVVGTAVLAALVGGFLLVRRTRG